MKFRSLKSLKDTMIQKARGVFDYAVDLDIALFLKTFIEAMGEGLFSIQNTFKDSTKQYFPQTASGEFLEWWGGWENLPKKGTSPSSGTVIFFGNDASSIGTIIPLDFSLQSAGGLVAFTKESGEIEEKFLTVSDFTVSSGIATVTTDVEHGFIGGQTPVLDISGGIGVFTASEISIINDFSFSFETDLADETGLTGTCTEWLARLLSETESEGFGSNIAGGSFLALETEIPNIKNSAIVDSEGMTGGVDDEEEERYRERIMLSRQQMRGVFSDDQNTTAGLRVIGNTRIFIDPPTLGTEDSPKVAGFQPRAGEAVFYIVRDLPDGTIESPVDPAILDETKQAIIEFGKKPSHVSESDIYCFSPLLHSVNFTLQIFPDNSQVRANVERSINTYFLDNARFGENLDLNGIISNIQQTPELSSFVLVSPSSVPVPPKHIPVVGTINFT